MKPLELKVARIGNSRGIRLPAATLKRFGITGTVIMEERSDGILLRPRGPAPTKLPWEDTAREMAAATEVWSEWDVTTADGIEIESWPDAPPARVAEGRSKYNARDARSVARKKR